jgi:hypothetical protein
MFRLYALLVVATTAAHGDELAEKKLAMVMAVMMSLAIVFCLGFACGCWWMRKLVSIEPETIERELDKLLMKFTFSELRSMALAFAVPHGRTKSVAVGNLVATEKLATEQQAKLMRELQAKYKHMPRDVSLCLVITPADISTRTAASAWIFKVRQEFAE